MDFSFFFFVWIDLVSMSITVQPHLWIQMADWDPLVQSSEKRACSLFKDILVVRTDVLKKPCEPYRYRCM